MLFDLKKCFECDVDEIKRTLKYIKENWRASDYIDVANKRPEAILCTFIANYYYETVIAQTLELTNQPMYQYLDSEHKYSDCVIDTVEGVEIKTTRWEFGKTVKYNDTYNPNWLHNARKVAIYNYISRTLWIYDLDRNVVSSLDNLSFEFDWSYYISLINMCSFS